MTLRSSAYLNESIDKHMCILYSEISEAESSNSLKDGSKSAVSSFYCHCIRQRTDDFEIYGNIFGT